MILHHYEASPFSEKIRLMFGHTNYSWESAISPAMPPRPIVQPLVDAYRLMPVAQIGADIFCDTRVISSEIAALTDTPELAAENVSTEVQEFIDHVDTKLLMAGLASLSTFKLVMIVSKRYSPWAAFKFIKDRVGLMKTSTQARMDKDVAQEIVSKHNNDMEQRLSKSNYLFGDSPTIADFSAYHLIWFKTNISGADVMNAFPAVLKWYERMANIGHGQRKEISPSDVMVQARDNQPREVPADMTHDSLIGKTVAIHPAAFPKMLVGGELVGSSDSRWIILRENSELGKLHIHFPKKAYDLVQLG